MSDALTTLLGKNVPAIPDEEHYPELKEREYSAFWARPKPVTLDVRYADGSADNISYGYVVKVSSGRIYYAKFYIFTSFMSFKVEGKNLEPVVDSLNWRRCAIIQQWSPRLFDKPADGEPIILKIEPILKPLAEAMSEAQVDLARN